MSQFSWRQRVSWRLQTKIVPTLESSHEAFLREVAQRLTSETVWLDLGCGRELVPRWIHPERFARLTEAVAGVEKVVGLDIDFASLKDNQFACRVCGDAGALPFADGSFDLVTANMVVEHIETPSSWLREVRRVLKPGGVLVFHTPNILSPVIAIVALLPDWLKKRIVRLTEGREDKDVFPTRYRLNTPDVIRDQGGCAGFIVENLRTVCTSPLTQFLGPMVVLELLIIRLLLNSPAAFARPDIIAVLRA